MTHEHKQVTAEELVGRTRDNGTAEVVFDFPDGSQVYVTLWGAGTFSAAKREHSSDMWGPPADGMRGWHVPSVAERTHEQCRHADDYCRYDSEDGGWNR